jgi:hypothetical protein
MIKVSVMTLLKLQRQRFSALCLVSLSLPGTSPLSVSHHVFSHHSLSSLSLSSLGLSVSVGRLSGLSLSVLSTSLSLSNLGVGVGVSSLGSLSLRVVTHRKNVSFIDLLFLLQD